MRCVTQVRVAAGYPKPLDFRRINMNTSPIKIVLVANIIFLTVSIVFLSNAYLGSYEGLSVSADKTKKIEEIINKETEIEKLRDFSLVSLGFQNDAYETIDSAIKVSSTAIKLFSIMFSFNILFSLTYLHKNKKKSNQQIKRME